MFTEHHKGGGGTCFPAQSVGLGMPDQLVLLRLFKCCDLWLQQTGHEQPSCDLLNNGSFDYN